MSIRICSYNIEWFNHLFNKDNTLKDGNDEKKRFAAISKVLKHIEPDLLGIVEGPNTTADGLQSTVTKLENFAQSENLSINKAMTGFISPGTQEIALLYNPGKLTVEHAPGGKDDSKSNPPFNGQFFYDTDNDRIKEVYKHYRPPLEALVTVNNTNKEFKVLIAHTKSKGIFSSVDMLHWERENHRNRLKLFAECGWIRRRVEEWLEERSKVVVMGDFNDGPGMDFYEMKYGRSAVETVMGDIFNPDQILRSFSGKPKWTYHGWKPSTVRFEDRITGTQVTVLLDHIFTSQNLEVVEDSYKIWNPYDNEEAKSLKKDLMDASDHFPVSVDLDL